MLLLQPLSCGKEKDEQKKLQQITEKEETEQYLKLDDVQGDIQVKEETPDTSLTQEITYRLPEVPEIRTVNIAEIETKLSQPVQIDYIN